MGLVMKASKCLSLSIQRGQTTKVQFYLKNNSEHTFFNIFSVIKTYEILWKITAPCNLCKFKPKTKQKSKNKNIVESTKG